MEAELSISNSGTTSLVCQIHEKDFSKTFIELPTRSGWAETGVQEKVILSPIVEPANNKNSGFSAEAGAGCAFGGSRLQQEREVGGGFLRRVTGSDPPEKEGTTGEVSSDDPRFPLTRTLAFIHSNPFTPCIF